MSTANHKAQYVFILRLIKMQKMFVRFRLALLAAALLYRKTAHRAAVFCRTGQGICRQTSKSSTTWIRYSRRSPSTATASI
ncbi:hypothetical protein C8F01DRAFT_1254965 [Mycena amicta]|nr:hypothetical protein C8F01DRAFT_1254965 [Mycena amicta]